MPPPYLHFKLNRLDHVGTIGSLWGVLLPGLIFVATLSASCTRQPQTGTAANHFAGRSGLGDCDEK
ncbi:MAG TPA: hypothetical protein VFX97_19365 [Pyrinomonadaceae bacterium]|nr:hypothetical protein [Pyrinomonadaceae bacterium]